MSCTNRYCNIIGKRDGQATSGNCTCLRPLPKDDQLKLKQRLYTLETELAEARAEIERLEKKTNRYFS